LPSAMAGPSVLDLEAQTLWFQRYPRHGTFTPGRVGVLELSRTTR
jgi:hypothetical protein